MTGDTPNKPVSWLLGLVGKANLAVDLDEDDLGRIGQDVVRFCEQDEDSRREWMDLTESALNLANQVKESKDTPWPKASNIKYPIITEAAIEVNARIYPEIIKGNQVVKTKVTGLDADGSKRERGYRISRHMNWQLTEEMTEWEWDFDRLTICLPVVGLCYRKTYFSPEKGRNVSELVLPDACVVHYKIKDLETARRITHRLFFYPNDIYERQAMGLWRDVTLPTSGDAEHYQDPDAPCEFLEQHGYLDLDGDGYKEPYIITVHRQTRQVTRIVARFEADKVHLGKKNQVVRIEPTHYFTPFHFIPNPDGSFYSKGFGQLMEPLNESVNTSLNQMIDAETKKIMGGGFIGRGARIKGGVLSFTMGEYKMVDVPGQALRENLVEVPAPGASPVLFQLLGFLVEASKKISIPDVLSGDAASMGKDASPNTVMAMIEQGMKVFNVIYKRIYRSLGEEFKKLYRLNSIHLDPETYFTVQGPPPPLPPQMQQMMQMQGQQGGQPQMPMGPDPNALYVAQTQQMMVGMDDYRLPDIDVVPVADPSLASDLQRAAKAQVLMSLMGSPGIQPAEVVRMVVRDLHLDDEHKILLPNDPQTGQPPKPSPPPQMIVAQAKAQDMQARLQMDMHKHQVEVEEMMAKIAQAKANTVLALAKAEKEAGKNALEQYKAELQALTKDTEQQIGVLKEAIKQHGQTNGGGVRGVENTPNHPEGGQTAERGPVPAA